MAINSIGDNLSLYGEIDYTEKVEDKTILGKDDFMKLLLVELQYQDPTDPVDSATILTQTSQLAGLEASENTNQALADLAESLGTSQQFSTIAAIGKMGDTGSNAIGHDEGTITSFELYFPEDVASGEIEILNTNGEIVAIMDIQQQEDSDGNLLDKRDSGVYQFDWDGKLSDGSLAQSGVYYITSSYRNPDGDSLTTRVGAYPIESVRFEDGQALVKLGSQYVPIDQIKEIY